MAKKKHARKPRTPTPRAGPTMAPFQYWVEYAPPAPITPESAMARLNQLGSLGWTLLFIGHDTRMMYFIGDTHSTLPTAGTLPAPEEPPPIGAEP